MIQKFNAKVNFIIFWRCWLYKNNLRFFVWTFDVFLGPRGPLVPPLFVRGTVRAKNMDQLYSYLNHHRTTTNLSDFVLCMSGGVWWFLVVSGGVWRMSGGVNVYMLI